MLNILSYEFFQHALIAGVLISLIASILGVFVVMRKEANISHSIAHILFLGVATSLFIKGNYYIFSFLFAFLGAALIFFIEKTNFISKESSKEIIAQGAMAGAIFILGFLGNITLDINNFLFGSILFVSSTDILILSIFAFFTYLLFFLFGKNFLSITLSEEIARTKRLPIAIYNFSFILLLAFFIAISIKMFGILLIGAFLVIPTNTAKILATNLKQVFFITGGISLFSVTSGLFSSYFLNTSAGATIVLILIIIFFIAFSIKKFHS